VVLPKSKQIAAEGGIGLDWLMSEFTTVSLSGDITDLRYRNVVEPTSSEDKKLIDTRTVHGQGTIAHRWTARQTVGVFYDYQDLAFPDAHSRTTTHSFQGFDEFAITPHMKLTLFGGPEYSRQHDQVEVNFFFFTITIPTFKTMWSPTAGAQYSWEGARNAFRSTYVRKITDGGGLVGAVTLNSGDAQFKRRLTPKWDLNIGGFYATDTALGFAGTSGLHSWAANGGLERKITQNLYVDVGYSHLHQTRNGTVAGLDKEDHNRVVLSLDYRWDHPVGR
jgi:hypothetical protein